MAEALNALKATERIILLKEPLKFGEIITEPERIDKGFMSEFDHGTDLVE